MDPKPGLRQINHKTMRAIVGLIALLLSPVVWCLAETNLQSISISYWTDAHDVFVGSLTAIAFFLFAYNGTGERRDLEYWVSKASSFFALCVALFPTEGFKGDGAADAVYEPARWVAEIASFLHLEVGEIHVGAAVLFFACLVILIFFFSVRAAAKGQSQRALAYRVIGGFIVGGIAVGGILHLVFDVDDWLFWTEAWALSWFGIGWALAGTYKEADDAQEDAGGGDAS